MSEGKPGIHTELIFCMLGGRSISTALRCAVIYKKKFKK
jgi:hypothetical protein